MKKLIPLLFVVLSGSAFAESPTKILECSFEYSPVTSVALYKFDHQYRLIEGLPDGNYVSRVMPEKEWNDKLIYLHAEPGAKNFIYMEGKNWNFSFETSNSYMRGGADCWMI